VRADAQALMSFVLLVSANSAAFSVNPDPAGARQAVTDSSNTRCEPPRVRIVCSRPSRIRL
jgi:hypothetical protein